MIDLDSPDARSPTQPLKGSSCTRKCYGNVDCYRNKSYLIKQLTEEHQVNCTAFVETKNDATTNINYRDWIVITHHGNRINTNLRGGSIMQFNRATGIRKENAPRINNPYNDALHISIPFLDDTSRNYLFRN